MKKFMSVLVYLVLVVIFLEFDIKKLFDLKQMLLVIIGAVILYIPSLKTGSKINIDKELAGQNALWASLIQTFILFYNVLATNYENGERFLNTALACRPLLYGFCIWVILHNDEVHQGTEEEKKLQGFIENAGKEQEIKGREWIEQEKAEQKRKITGKEAAEGIIQDSKVQEITENEDRGHSLDKEIMTAELEGAEEQENKFIIKGGLPDIEECRHQFLDAGLTKREAEVALLILKCMSNAEIAEELFISETTVKKHVSNIFAKLKISKREQVRNILY